MNTRLNRLKKNTVRSIQDTFELTRYQFLPREFTDFRRNQFLISGVLRGLPIIGYFMATMSIADCIFVIIPLRLQDPVWELASLGSVANHTWGILIGFGFMLTSFSRETIAKIRPIEILIINLFRTFLLLLAFIFIMGMPLVIVDTLRINNTESEQIKSQVTARQTVISQVEANLNSISDIRQLLEIGQGLGLNLSYTPQSTVNGLKQEIQNKLPEAKEKLIREANMAISSKQKNQWKASIRTLLQLFIFSIANTILWFKTRKLKTLIE